MHLSRLQERGGHRPIPRSFRHLRDELRASLLRHLPNRGSRGAVQAPAAGVWIAAPHLLAAVLHLGSSE